MFTDLAQLEQKAQDDRRSKRRFPLRCPVSIQKKEPPSRAGQAVGETVNVSSLGFYGIVNQAFAPGEHLDCELKLPVESSRLIFTAPRLKCNAVVLRVDERPDGQFGVACMITNYSFFAAGEREG